MRNICVFGDPSSSSRLRGCEKSLRHPESAKRDEGSQNTKSLQFREPSPSTWLRMTDFFTTSQDDERAGFRRARRSSETSPLPAAGRSACQRNESDLISEKIQRNCVPFDDVPSNTIASPARRPVMAFIALLPGPTHVPRHVSVFGS